MKKILSIVAIAGLFTLSAQAQTSAQKLGRLLSNMASTVYSSPITLDGEYSYNGVAVSATSSEGGILTNLAGSAITSGIESKADEYLAKVGVKPGAMSWTFNAQDRSFVVKVGNVSVPGTYKVGNGERTVTLTFGKALQFLSMTGTLESKMSGARMLFPADKAMTFLKKLASATGYSSSQVSTVAKLAEGYDNYRIGFRLEK